MSQTVKPISVQDGLILVYKPPGMPSKDVSRWFQKKFGRIKMGHVGTLDPIAEGLLPLLLGRATRLQDFLLQGTKVYEFDVAFGKTTDTLDCDGEVVAEMPVGDYTLARLQEICASLQGDFLQIPPIYSAIKFQGKPLYEYARKGKSEQVPLESLQKTVQIYSLDCLHWDKEALTARFRILCEKGTYVRVVGAKIAAELGTVGMIVKLVRLASGDFNTTQAFSLEEIEKNLESIENIIIPMNAIRLEIPTWQAFDGLLVQRLRMGQEMHVEMKEFEVGLSQQENRRVSIRSIDRMILMDNNGQSFGIGSAQVLNTGRIAVRMRRGLS